MIKAFLENNGFVKPKSTDFDRVEGVFCSGRV